MKPTVSPLFSCIDLFCGCGGNSWGMLQGGKSRSLEPLLALDNDPYALATYQHNMPSVEVVQGDIRETAPSFLLDRIGLRPGALGCLIASPPCQTYSRNNRLPKDKHDHRYVLYTHTLKMIRGIRPWVVFMENVPEMETCHDGIYHTDFLACLEQLGYTPRYWTVDAADYGVPQHRQRLVYLAYRNEMGVLPQCPPPTHGEASGLFPWVTVEEAIADLPARSAGVTEESFMAEPAHLLKRSAYAWARRPVRSSLVFNHSTRELNAVQLRRLQSLKEGQAYNDLPADLRPAKGYKASYGRLWRSKPAQTLTTYLAYPSSGRFSHYEQDRVMSIRESLRLQSFDDDFRVLGNLSQQSTQVGNAVPPLLATAFKGQIVADLEKVNASFPDHSHMTDETSVSSKSDNPQEVLLPS
ncbi:MAG TPA: DNA cytosine methyltransferase [Ktedonobacteraceae bacterium]|nr:DNA cytosine methyltransferase [Ktedonobacteraceae bacterium]